MKRVAWLILVAVTAKADILYTWTVFGNSGQSGSYSFSSANFPTGSLAGSTNLTTTGSLSPLPNYSCNDLSAEGCAWSVELTSAPNSISDLGTNFGQAALYVCWDAGATGCNTGINVQQGALFPDLNINQFGTYWGTMDVSGALTELVITDPPSVPEPGSAWLLLAATLVFGGYAFVRWTKTARRH